MNRKVSKFVLLGASSLVLFSVLAWNAYRDYIPKKTGEKQPLRSFTEFKDTLITVERVNNFTGFDLTSNDIGLPVGISGTDTWLIPIGRWYMRREMVSLQGGVLTGLTPFSDYPYRNIITVFKGTFHGVIAFHEASNNLTWVYRGELDSIQYLRSKSFHFIIEDCSGSSLSLKEIVMDKDLVYSSKNEILTWAVTAVCDSLITTEAYSNGYVHIKLPISGLFGDSNGKP